MFVSKMSLPRRTFLRGMGAAVALPMLEAMVPAFTALAQSAANPPRRFGAVYIPHGVILDAWTPTTDAAFEFPEILKPLETFRDQVVVVSNLTRPKDTEGGTHAVSSANWLTGAVAKRTIGEDFRAGVSIDQMIANKIGGDTLFRSLELATEDFSGYVGACDIGYACAYMNTVAWGTPIKPLPVEINPRVVFERMFGRTGTREQRAAHTREDRSILDALTSDVRDLEKNLGSRDRARLSEYLNDVREIERRIEKTESRSSRVIEGDAPLGIPDSFEEHAALIFDLLAVAYQVDITRVFTFMLARELSMRTYIDLGITEPHHPLSHHGNNPEKVALHAKLNTYHMQLFAKFLDKLRSTPDGDGSVLDHSLILYGSGMSDGNKHSPEPLPLVAVGGGVGKGHRHVRAPESSPTGNLWLSVADKFGITLDRFGISTERVEL